MTRQDVGYYVLAVLLFAASIPLYRIILEHGRDGDQPARSPQPVAAQRRPVPATPPLTAVTSRGFPQVECIHGRLYRRDSSGAAYAGECPVVVGPADPQNSPASDDSQARSMR